MSITLRKRKNTDGITSLQLDIYHSGRQSIETLKQLQLAKLSNLAEPEQNKQKIKLSEQIAITRGSELEASRNTKTVKT